jgi:hypothetical protein
MIQTPETISELKTDASGIWIDTQNESISYPEEANEALLDVEDKSFWFKHRNDVIKGIIHRFPFQGNFADIGGGNGFQARFIAANFSEKDIYFLEPGYQGCLNAKKRGLKHVFNIPFQKFDFKKYSVTGVGLFDVVEHIENDVKFMSELKDKLPSGSIIYVTVPAHKYLWSDSDDYGGHYRRYNMKMIRKLADDAGLKLLYSSYFFTYVPAITYFLKHIPYKIRGKRDSKAILESEMKNLSSSPSGFALSIFDYFHKKELRKIENTTINHGGSCFAVFKT